MTGCNEINSVVPNVRCLTPSISMGVEKGIKNVLQIEILHKFK